MQNPIGTAAFLVRRQEIAIPKGGIMEPTNLTASGSKTPSTISPFTKVDIVLLTGPPKSKHAIPPKTAPNTNLEPF